MIISDELKKLQYFLNILRKKEIDNNFLYEFYEAFALKENNNYLTNLSLDNKSEGKLLSFIPNSNTLKLNIDSYLYTVNYIKESFKYLNNLENDLDYNYYVGIYVLLHEIEHSYQYLMAEDKIEAPIVVLSTYKLIYDYIYKERKMQTIKEALEQRKRVLRFQKQCGHLALERNANVEALNKTLELIKLEGNIEEELLFEEALMANILMGYSDEQQGSLIETVKVLDLLPNLKGKEQINSYDFFTKLRYGMALNKNELEKLVNIILNANYKRFVNIKKNMRVRRINK